MSYQGNSVESLWERLNELAALSPLRSRCHPLQGFGQNAWVKRDDELSFGVSGSKYRKYSSLLTKLKEQGITDVVMAGSALSNNVLAALQLVKPLGIKLTLFLKRAHGEARGGNQFFFQLLQEGAEIHWLDTEGWKKHHELMKDRAAALGGNPLILPEGASHAWSAPGSASLAIDILRQEKLQGWHWPHIWIDAGTGFTAQCLIAVMGSFSVERDIHVVDMAGDSKNFADGLKGVVTTLQSEWNIPATPMPYHLRQPVSGASFGSVNQAVWSEIRRMATEEGILVDPLYSAKLFMTARDARQKNKTGNEPVLMIHSGGALTLSGFQSFLE